MVNIEVLLKNAYQVGDDGKKRAAFMAAIGWDNFIELLESYIDLEERAQEAVMEARERVDQL